jgi:uncharacterized protein
MLKIDLQKLREGDEILAVDHTPKFFDLDDDDWHFVGRITGEVTFHLTDDDIFATGELHARAVGRCGRCLDPVPVEVVAKIDYIYLPADEEPTDDLAVEHVTENAPDLAYYRGEVLEPFDELRDSLLLALPTLPIASEDGTRCLTCGRDLTLPAHHEEWPEEAEEPEWKRKLRGLGRGR